MENVDVFSAIDNVKRQNYPFLMHYIGPHVSIKENISLAPGRAASLGATGFAIFTKNQRIWSAPKQKKEDADALFDGLTEDSNPVLLFYRVKI